MKKIPERWLPYKALGKRIEGTRFVAFKVPLSEKLNSCLPENQRFSPDRLIEVCPKLSLVIDLTNTYRYYDKKEFTSKSIQHEKICVPGKQCPTSDLVHRFFEIVDKFVESAHSNDSLIGVHCTHGVNRTGYFICRYMIQRLGFDPVSALSAFQYGRGYAIERAEYIKDLKNCFLREHTEVDGTKTNSSYKTAQTNRLYRTEQTISYRTPQTSSYRTGQTNSYRTPQTTSYRTGQTNSYRTAQTSSYKTTGTKRSDRSANTNSSQVSTDSGRSKMLPSGKGYMSDRNYHEGRNDRNYHEGRNDRNYHEGRNDRNYHEGRKYGHSSREYRNSSYKSNCQEERKVGHKYYGHTSSYNIEKRMTPVSNSDRGANFMVNSGIYPRDQSDDWRANNPYTKRHFTVPVVHTKYTVD